MVTVTQPRGDSLHEAGGAVRNASLLAEAGQYRWSDEPDDRRSENPVDEHNHALAALRYLVSRLDKHKLARAAGKPATDVQPPDAEEIKRREEAERRRRWREMVEDEDDPRWIPLDEFLRWRRGW